MVRRSDPFHSGSGSKWEEGNFRLDHNATVSIACEMVRAHLGIETPLRASIHGSELDPNKVLLEYVQPDDEVEFSAADGSRNSFRSCIVTEPPAGSYRVFTNINHDSLTKGDVFALNEMLDAQSQSQYLKQLLRNKYGSQIPEDSELHVYLPGGVRYVEGTLHDFDEHFPEARYLRSPYRGSRHGSGLGLLDVG